MGKVGLDAKETCRIPDDSGREQRIAEVSMAGHGLQYNFSVDESMP